MLSVAVGRALDVAWALISVPLHISEAGSATQLPQFG